MLNSIFKVLLSVTLLVILTVFAAVGWVAYLSVDVIGDGVKIVQQEGLKGAAERLWCGSKGCR
jgi:hypothetical protein